jgi:hypothetical protein
MRALPRVPWLAVPVVVLLPGCYRSPAVRFNDTIVEGTQKLHKAGEAFGRTVSAALSSGNENDFRKMEAAYEDAQKVLKRVRDDIKALRVPPGKAAKELHKDALEFFDQEERRLVHDFEGIMRVVKDKQLRPGDKHKRIMDILTEAKKIEDAHIAWLKDTQRKFAEENHLKIKER